MTDTDSQLSDELAQAALDGLKERATKLGVKFHPNIKADALREKVAAAQAEAPEAVSKAPVASTESATQQLRMESSKLIRIKLSCMNPAKKEWDGEIISVGNSAVGTHKKFIPFNADEGWHVPKIIYDALVERQCQVFVSQKDSRGNTVRKGKLIKEFAIEVLPQLTLEELQELGRRQAMAGSVN